MCDEKTERDVADYLARAPKPSRRDMGKLAAGATVLAMLRSPANAAEISEREVMIETPDGVADCHFAYPKEGAHAAVLVWPDIMGLRPAFKQMGRRLAESGYAVLTVNPFYRSAKHPVLEEGQSFADPEIRTRLIGYRRAISNNAVVTDAVAFLAWLDLQDEVDVTKQVGTTGYCMGGPMVMRTAAAVPGRIGAGASFHGGGLATDGDSSPHLLIDQMDADFLIAIAENDDADEPEVKDTLADAFDAEGLKAEIEVYEGTLHGWCPPDSRVYNEAQAEKAWSRLLALFEGGLS